MALFGRHPELAPAPPRFSDDLRAALLSALSPSAGCDDTGAWVEQKLEQNLRNTKPYTSWCGGVDYGSHDTAYICLRICFWRWKSKYTIYTTNISHWSALYHVVIFVASIYVSKTIEPGTCSGSGAPESGQEEAKAEKAEAAEAGNGC